MAESDDAVLARLQQGDQDALVAFIESRRQPLLVFIERKLSAALRRKIEPADILQEVTLSALSGLDGMDFTGRDPFGWLCQLAERRIIDAHRRLFGAQKRSADREVGLGAGASENRPGGLIDLLVASITTPSRAFAKGQREFYLLEALESLPEESRTALRLRYVEGLPSKEIAQRLGKSDGAVRVLLSRSLNKLQQMLSKNAEFESFLTNE